MVVCKVLVPPRFFHEWYQLISEGEGRWVRLSGLVSCPSSFHHSLSSVSSFLSSSASSGTRILSFRVGSTSKFEFLPVPTPSASLLYCGMVFSSLVEVLGNNRGCAQRYNVLVKIHHISPIDSSHIILASDSSSPFPSLSPLAISLLCSSTWLNRLFKSVNMLDRSVILRSLLVCSPTQVFLDEYTDILLPYGNGEERPAFSQKLVGKQSMNLANWCVDDTLLEKAQNSTLQPVPFEPNWHQLEPELRECRVFLLEGSLQDIIMVNRQFCGIVVNSSMQCVAIYMKFDEFVQVVPVAPLTEDGIDVSRIVGLQIKLVVQPIPSHMHSTFFSSFPHGAELTVRYVGPNNC
eukprot:TRINITY_DN6214_c0_g1_i3.p1 TRINITY_DN6214_c0_g1~~TRINITY_DN6214_c0_g1_i3.p1  ORF type:complete len:349 (-),score=-16.82 TRINITY_DN6214_c0_g1_i3:4-1050(-)